MVKFEKYHGLGNDFIIINNEELIEKGIKEEEYSKLVEEICDRHLGIGADGCIVLKKIDDLKVEMMFFNQDGSRASMCGNGIRCFSHYIYENQILKGNKYPILTGSGELEVEITPEKLFKCKVNMGRPVYNIDAIPLNKALLKEIKDGNIIEENLKSSVDYTLLVNDKEIKLDSLFMGTIHTVTFVDNLDEFSVESFGEKIENNPLYPNKTNVNFVEIIDRKNIKMKTWERGAGLTFACGTGATASVVVGSLKYGMLEPKVEVHLPKGILEIEISNSGDIFMTGPSKKIGEGVYRYEGD